MTDQNKDRALSSANFSGLEGRDCVPFFKSDKSQIVFEFWYLVGLFSLACTATILLQLFGASIGLRHSDKLVLFAALGGFLRKYVRDKCVRHAPIRTPA